MAAVKGFFPEIVFAANSPAPRPGAPSAERRRGRGRRDRAGRPGRRKPGEANKGTVHPPRRATRPGEIDRFAQATRSAKEAAVPREIVVGSRATLRPRAPRGAGHAGTEPERDGRSSSGGTTGCANGSLTVSFVDSARSALVPALGRCWPATVGAWQVAVGPGQPDADSALTLTARLEATPSTARAAASSLALPPSDPPFLACDSSLHAAVPRCPRS